MLDWSKLTGVSADLLLVIQPYLPALARAGDEVLNGFVLHLSNKDWDEIDALMYQHLTLPERQALDAQVLSGAIEAAQARFDRIQLTHQIVLQVVIKLLLLGVGL